jgi:hypothetical protein
MHTYRNVTVGDDGIIRGERTLVPGGDYYAFSGRPDLMRIDHAIGAAPNAVSDAIVALADGYGAPGFFPGGYDWSGVRDSSDEALAAMDALAVAWHGDRAWPWEPPRPRTVGRFTYDPATGAITGPAQYLAEQGRARIAAIAAGTDPGFGAIASHMPERGDVVGALLVTLQTDYAGWAGMREFAGRLAR